MRIRFATALGVLLCILLSAPVFADDTERNSLHAGAWAVQFRITDNFTLGNFNGTLLSVKRHTSDKSAFRAGITFHLQNADTEQMSSGSGTLRRDSRDDYSTRIDLQYLAYPSPTAPVNLFLGAGPFFSYSRSEIHQIEPTDAVQVSKAWSLGLGSALGVEWFPFRSLGVHAEYGLSLSYSSGKQTTEVSGPNPSSAEATTDTWAISGDNVLFGLSVYF